MGARGSWSEWRSIGISALVLSALPGVVLAIPSARSAASSDKAADLFGSFTPAGVDTRLAALAPDYASPTQQAVRNNSAFRFTPAGVGGNSGRMLTVAVRSRDGANALAFKQALDPAKLGLKEAGPPVTIRPSSYSLGAARGLQNFTLPQIRRDRQAPALTDIARNGGLALDRLGNDKPSRFGARVSVSRDVGNTAQAAPLADDVRYDLGGSFSVTRSVALTAGVRYERDADGAQRLTDSATDQQAVYVGTLIRF